MEILYSAPAVERMQQRKIAPADVVATISSPDGVIPQSRDKSIFHKRIRSRKDNSLAIVALKRRDGCYETLTVMIIFEVTL